MPRNWQPRSGPDRRGVIPRVETPEEKIARLVRHGWPGVMLNRSKQASHEFAGYDFGNKELPAYDNKLEILQTIEENRISMLVGPTGSGKTTQVGQYALERGMKTIFLVPRRVIADNIGERVEEELSLQLGAERAAQLVGISHSERNTVDDDSRILVMTSGTFTKRLSDLAERWRGEKVLVVADEIHEGNLETEFASALAVRQVESDGAWRLVFASATPDASTLTKTYSMVNEGRNVPVIEIEGRPHELDMVEEPDKDIVEAYLEHSVGVQKTLVFVDGKRSINQAIREISQAMTDDEREYTRFYKLHADISEAARREIFEMRLPPGYKAVVVSTSAGQSGITIPGVGLVVTSGLTKSPELDDEQASGLPVRHCTQAEIIQQGGRAGRDISGGKCVLARPIGHKLFRNRDNPLYDFVPIDEREPHIPPEIYHTNISRNVLSALALGHDFFELNDYLQHSVSQRTIGDAYELLANLGAVDQNYAITDLGRLMDMFPLRPELGRAVAEVVCRSAGLPIQVYTLAIAAAIEAGGLADFDNTRGSEWKQCLRSTTDDDFMAQLDLMLASREHYYPNRRCRDSHSSRQSDNLVVDFDSMSRVDELELSRMDINPRRAAIAHKAFDKMCRLIGLDPRDLVIGPPREDEEDQLRDIFLLGMPELIYKKVATERGRGKYENVLGFDNPVRREISSRSLLSMGQAAVSLVAGYPRWYIDGHGRRHDIIEMGFVTSPDQVRRILGHLAVHENPAEIRGGRLVQGGTMRYGNLLIGGSKFSEVNAVNSREVTLLAGAVLQARPDAIEALLRYGVPIAEIQRLCKLHSAGSSSVEEVGSKLWSEVARYQA